jgi:hypothetical protein
MSPQNLLSRYKFHENRRKEGRPFLLAQIHSHLRVYDESVERFESKECLGKLCVRSHRAQHLRTCI